MTTRALLLLLTCILSLFVKAQNPVADFTANKTSGCAPLAVSFSDNSSGDPKFWNWDLGNGSLSNKQNPSTTYSKPGTYEVTLVVRNSNGTNGVTKTNYITVFPSPTVSFTSDKVIGCAPSTFKFTDNSTSNEGSITGWEWNFGDGTTSTSQNPSHEYTNGGFYTISLKATSSTGCTGAATRTRLIRVLDGVNAVFTAPGSVSCRAPFVVNFNNETSGPGNLTYSWDFGNGNTSTQTNPSETFNTGGVYTVTLKALSDYGCSDTVQNEVMVQENLVSFTGPDSVCINNPASFTNTSSAGATSSFWSVGDSTFADSGTATRSFSIPGKYVVKLVSDYPACRDSVVRQLVVADLPVVDFSSDKIAGCTAPFTVSFRDLTPAAAGWLWDFGDGSTSTEKDPVHTYTTLGRFSVKLTVTSNAGCTNSVTKEGYIDISKPTITISSLPTGGCAPFRFTPTAGIASKDGIASFVWDFGDGGTSTAASPVHVYSATGNYDVKLVVTTGAGCTESLTVNNAVRVGNRPTVDFTVTNPTACSSSEVLFLDGSVNANRWLWDFGDGTQSSDRNPSHRYDSVGNFDVTLTAYGNSFCPASKTKAAIVKVLPPVAKFDFIADCAHPGSVRFVNRSKVDSSRMPVKYLWQFGDAASTIDSTYNTSFVYPGPGTYKVQLTVINDTCSSTITKNIVLSDEKADFSVDGTSFCRGAAATFTATNSDPDKISAYEWTIGPMAPFTGDRKVSRRLSTNGNYDIRLVITNADGCRDTAVKTAVLSVNGPVARFGPVDSTGCANSNTQFADSTVSANRIVKWSWDFGDGTTQDFSGSPFIHQYKDSGTYSVKLTVEDQDGCSSQFVRNDIVRISKVVPLFTSDRHLVCPSTPVQFTDSSAGNIVSYSWNFGDGGSSTLKDPVHSYADSTTDYPVTLTITDDQGCTDSLQQSQYISVSKPVPGFIIPDTSSLCPPFEANFISQAKNYQRIYWDFGDLSDTSLLDTARHFYNDYGIFNAKQVVVGYGGCSDSLIQPIRIINPASTVFQYNPLNACNRLTVDFHVEPAANTHFYLSFGDGEVDSSQTRDLSHFYSSPSFYSPSILLKDNSGCQVTVPANNAIRVIGAQPFFSIDKKEFCDSGTVYMTNFTIGNDPVTSYQWDLGDGSTSSDENHIHSYTKPGTYIVSLTVNTASGCSDTRTDTVIMHSTPETVIVNADSLCINPPAALKANLIRPDTADIRWNWNFGDGTTSSVRNPIHIFTKPGDYTVNLNTSIPFGCSSSSSKVVHVVPPPGVSLPEGMEIVSGRDKVIDAIYSGNIATYNWSPPQGLNCTDCPNPVASPKKTTTYTISVTDINGCVASAQITIPVVCGNRNLFLPNTFSPNGDGVNDVFYPHGTGLFRIKGLRIFNRWGEMVFERTNFIANQSSEGWNGIYKGRKAAADVYVFVVDIECENGQIVPLRGNVMLLR